MGRFFLWVFAVIGGLVSVAVALGIFAALRFAPEKPTLPERIVLELEIDGSLSEQIGQDPLQEALFGARPQLHTVIAALDAAAKDSRIVGLGLVFGPGDLPFTQAQELRTAIAKFRDAGKFVHAYTDTFGELAPANAPYFLASAAEKIWLQPLGLVGLSGFAVEMPYAKKALSEIGIEAQTFRRAEFKTAMNTFLEQGMTAPEREMWQALIDDMTRQLVGGIAQSRGVPEAAVRAVMDRAPIAAEDAKAAKLIDEIGYRDQYDEGLKQAGGEKARRVTLMDYAPLAPKPTVKDSPLALIVAEGPIMRGSPEGSPFNDGAMIAADELAAWIGEATEDDDIKAIVLRVNSPGGSAIASDTIRRAIRQAQAKDKRVIVSMGEAAASGGYWISMDADKIVAEGGTLTGSIGVFGGKFVSEKLWADLDINWDEVKGAPQANMWSPINAFSPSETATLNTMLDQIYTAFTDNVAAARNLPIDTVQAVARGRVWTGAQAKERGLVDEIGGLRTAIDIARSEIGRAGDDTAGIRIIPAPEPTWERFLRFAESGAVQMKSLALIARIAAWVEPFAAQIEATAPANNARMGPATVR
jgi:protease-4